MGKRDRKAELPDESAFEVNPFAGLDLGLGPVPEEQQDEPAEAETMPRGAVHVWLEKKGRGGKRVTVVEGFAPGFDQELNQLAGELRRHLGSGGTVYDTVIELQGDQRAKTAAWLESRGFHVKGEMPYQ